MPKIIFTAGGGWIFQDIHSDHDEFYADVHNRFCVASIAPHQLGWCQWSRGCCRDVLGGLRAISRRRE
eukprot:scaffold15150_cov26-Cyclotella_meneghiniana.AAC.1